MFKILVIDDNGQREEALKKTFRHDAFEIDYMFDKSSFFEKSKFLNKYDCIISDISLDKWATGDDIHNMFETVINTIGNEMPVVIYSSNFELVSVWTNELLNKKFNLIYTILIKLLSPEDAEKVLLEPYPDSGDIICNNIFLMLVKDKNYSVYKAINENQISILHISDLQFGDKEQNVELSKSFPSTLKREITKKNISPIDFIVITGDITYDGSPSQYSDAAKWIKKLCEMVLGEDYKDRVLLVPGNHDVNLSLCSLNKYKYKYPKERECGSDIKLEKRMPNTVEYEKYSLDPFRTFAFSITNDMKWIENESLCFVNDKFIYLGIRFIHLNALNPGRQMGKNKPEFSIDDEFMQSMQSKSKNLNEEEYFTVLITHPSPKYLGYDLDEEGSDEWITISNFLNDMNVNVYLYGHRHKNLRNVDIPIDKSKNMKISGTATLLCKTDIGDSRGFKIIKANVSNNKVTRCDIEKYNYDNDGEISKIT